MTAPVSSKHKALERAIGPTNAPIRLVRYEYQFFTTWNTALHHFSSPHLPTTSQSIYILIPTIVNNLNTHNSVLITQSLQLRHHKQLL